MLTILSALGGLAGSLIPDVIQGFFKDRQDKRDHEHELAMMREHRESAKLEHAAKMQEMDMRADIAESKALHQRVVTVGVPWVDALNSSVRPVVTYVFFAMFCAHLIGGLLVSWGMIDAASYATTVGVVWTAEVEMLFGATMGYWFGNRSMKHAKKLMGG